jgi:hypothetical protein
MHEIMSTKFYLGPKFGTLFNKKWITISELLHRRTLHNIEFESFRQTKRDSYCRKIKHLATIFHQYETITCT